MTVVAVTRAGVARLDFGDLVGQDGDVLHLVVSDTALERLRSRLERGGHGRRRRIRRSWPGSRPQRERHRRGRCRRR